MKNFQLKVKILSQTKIKDNYWHCELSAPQLAKNALPGQFINIRVSDNLDPLLRRPFSIHRIGSRVPACRQAWREFLPAGRHGASSRVKKSLPETIEILYEIIGQGTEILAEKKKGEYLDIIGPLGNGFDYPRTHELTNSRTHEPANPRPHEPANPRTIIIAGGMGVAPLVFLAEKLAHTPHSTAHRKPLVLIGARTKSRILCEKEFKNLGCEVKIATDDGSIGFKGRVTELLKHLLSAIGYPCLSGRQGLSAIYACGPEPMLKAVARIACENNIASQLSLEEHLACGMGACLGCVVSTKSGYKRACKDGPVFSGGELIW